MLIRYNIHIFVVPVPEKQNGLKPRKRDMSGASFAGRKPCRLFSREKRDTSGKTGYRQRGTVTVPAKANSKDKNHENHNVSQHEAVIRQDGTGRSYGVSIRLTGTDKKTSVY